MKKNCQLTAAPISEKDTMSRVLCSVCTHMRKIIQHGKYLLCVLLKKRRTHQSVRRKRGTDYSEHCHCYPYCNFLTAGIVLRRIFTTTVFTRTALAKFSSTPHCAPATRAAAGTTEDGVHKGGDQPDQNSNGNSDYERLKVQALVGDGAWI